MGRKSNYENGMYQQLMEIMGRLETVEKDSAQKIDRAVRNQGDQGSVYDERGIFVF